jgi:hypothetical protein
MVLIECWYYSILEKMANLERFAFFAKSPKIEIKQSKRPKKIKQSIPLCYPTIPSHSKNKSKQSKSRDNPGKYSTLFPVRCGFVVARVRGGCCGAACCVLGLGLARGGLYRYVSYPVIYIFVPVAVPFVFV